MQNTVALWTLGTMSLVFAAACDTGGSAPPKEEGAVPPPIASTKPGACTGGGGTIADPIARPLFPQVAGDYCLDPNGEVRAYGAEAKAPLDAVCTELFNGECEVYRAFGLTRVVTLRYVDGKGSPGSVNVNLSSFASPDGAYAFFTKRVLSDRDPTLVTAKPLDAGVAAALGAGIAYVWRGGSVAELSYTNEVETPDQLKKSSTEVLPVIARLLGEKLPGPKEPLGAVSALPAAGRLPLGIDYAAKDALGVKGLGAGAVGYYQIGAERFRVFTSRGVDEAQARDVYSLLKKATGGEAVKGGPFGAFKFTLRGNQDGSETHWLAAQQGSLVVAVGDESHSSGEGQGAAPARMTVARQFELLKPLVSPAGASPASSAGAVSSAGTASSADAASADRPKAPKP